MQSGNLREKIEKCTLNLENISIREKVNNRRKQKWNSHRIVIDTAVNKIYKRNERKN